MGKIFTFYTKTKKNARVTTAAALTGAYMALFKNKTVAIVQMGENEYSAEHIFGICGKDKENYAKMSGMNGLMLLLRAGNLTKNKIISCATRVGRDNVFLFTGDIKAGDKNSEKVRKFLYGQIADCFDVLLVDAGYREDGDIYGSGICMIPQDLRAAQDIYLKEKKTAEIFIINGFLGDSTASEKKFMHIFGRKIYFIPMDAGIMDAVVFGRLMNFYGILDMILRIRTVYKVFAAVERITDAISEKADEDTKKPYAEYFFGEGDLCSER